MLQSGPHNMHINTYRKVASRSTSRLVARPRIFWLLMKGKFDPYVLWPLAWDLWPLNSRPVYCSRLYGIWGNTVFATYGSKICNLFIRGGYLLPLRVSKAIYFLGLGKSDTFGSFREIMSHWSNITYVAVFDQLLIK